MRRSNNECVIHRHYVCGAGVLHKQVDGTVFANGTLVRLLPRLIGLRTAFFNTHNPYINMQPTLARLNLLKTLIGHTNTLRPSFSSLRSLVTDSRELQLVVINNNEKRV